MNEDVKSENLRIHSRAEQLIACLEGEISKRDARIVELESRYQRDVYGLNNEGDPIGGDPAGGYANDNARLRSELAAIKAQDTVGEVVGWYRLDRPYEMTPYPSVCATWHRLGAPVAPLYSAPVSEAKAQGVVMPERKTKADYGVYIDEFADEAAAIYNAALDEVARLNAAPAAPAADAGLVDMYRHLQTVTPYRFKKIQDASVTDGGDVLYFHKDRFDAALLDDIAAHRAKGVV